MPEVCLPTLRYFYDQCRTNLWTAYGFRDAFNLAVNWASTSNRCNQVEYPPNLCEWIISPIGFLTASSARLSWIDAGPPATDSGPALATTRFYRVFRYGVP